MTDPIPVPDAEATSVREWPPVVGEARHYAEALLTLQQQLIAMNMTYDTLDVLLNLPERYCSKVFMIPPAKFFSRDTLLAAFTAVGAPLIAVQNSALMARTQAHADFVSRQRKRKYVLSSASIRQISIAFLRQIASQGGITRAIKLSKKRRRQIARQGAQARWAKVRSTK